MNEEVIKEVDNLSMGLITPEAFFKKYPEYNSSSKLQALLIECINNKNTDDFDCLYVMAGKLGLDNSYCEIFHQLLTYDWHEEHSNIVESLKRIKSETSLIHFYNLINKRFDCYKYDKTRSLARRCINAIAFYNTAKAKEMIIKLTTDEDEIIREESTKVLKHLMIEN